MGDYAKKPRHAWLFLMKTLNASPGFALPVSACAAGGREKMKKIVFTIDNGFKRIFNLRQGISGWEREKFPVVQ